MADIYFTRRALRDIESIKSYSEECWGSRVAQVYLEDIYNALQQTAVDPKRGEQRKHRSDPYLMTPVGKHFAIYEAVADGIIVVTLLHGRQDIEAIIQCLKPELSKEVLRIRSELTMK